MCFSRWSVYLLEEDMQIKGSVDKKRRAEHEIKRPSIQEEADPSKRRELLSEMLSKNAPLNPSLSGKSLQIPIKGATPMHDAR